MTTALYLVLDELKSFFEDYKKLKDKEVNVEDFADAEDAKTAVRHAMALYDEQFPGAVKNRSRGA